MYIRKKNMKLKHYVIAVCTTFLLANCSSGGDDEILINPDTPETIVPEQIPEISIPIIINNIESSKEFAFIEDTITVNIEASGQTNIEVTNDNNNIIVTKVNENTFEVNAIERENIRLEFMLTNENNAETSSVDINFLEHGVINNKIVEGIEIDVDQSEKLTAVLGEPNYIQMRNYNGN